MWTFFVSQMKDHKWVKIAHKISEIPRGSHVRLENLKRELDLSAFSQGPWESAKSYHLPIIFIVFIGLAIGGLSMWSVWRLRFKRKHHVSRKGQPPSDGSENETTKMEASSSEVEIQQEQNVVQRV